MFGTQSTDRKRFVIGLLWRIGLFIAVTIALPLLLATFGSGCKASSSDCQGAGLMMIVAYFGLGPLALVLFVISLPSLLIPRFRAIGISPWWTLLVLLLVLANYQLLAYAVMLVMPALNGGSSYLTRPDYLLETLAILAVMAILPSRNGRVALRDLGWPAIVALGLAALVALGAVLRALDALPALMLSIMPLRIALRFLAWPTLIALVALPPVALYALWPRQGQTADSSPRPPPAHQLPLVRLGLIAAALTLVATLIGMPEMGPVMVLFLPAALLPIGLPTFAAYSALVLAVYLLAVRRGPFAYATLAVALLVFGSYAWQFVAKMQAKSADDTAIAAIAVSPLPSDVPDIVLSEDGNSRYSLLQRGDISTVLEQRGNRAIVAYVRDANGRPDQSPAPFGALPNRYLHFIAGRDSSVDQERTRYVWGSPYELRLVDGSSDQLLGAWYERDFDLPRFPPLLNINGGWMTQQRVSNGQQGQLVRAFLDKTLGPAPPPPKAAPAPAAPKPAKKRKSLMDLLYGEKSTVVETPR